MAESSKKSIRSAGEGSGGVLQLVALRQDPRPALRHSVEVASLGEQLQTAQGVHLGGGHVEEIAEHCSVKRGGSPAEDK